MPATLTHTNDSVGQAVSGFQPPISAQASGGSTDILVSILPFVVIFAIMYFLILRPQRQRMKERETMLTNIRRNDTIVTGGGIVGKVTKVVSDQELEVEIAKETRVKVARNLVAEVRVKGEPVSAARKTSPTAKKAGSSRKGQST